MAVWYLIPIAVGIAVVTSLVMVAASRKRGRRREVLHPTPYLGPGVAEAAGVPPGTGSEGLFKLRVRDYSRYFLTKNPFPYTSVPEERPVLYVDQERAARRLSDVLSSTITTGRSSHAILVGPYGSGKSHTLLYVRDIVTRQFASSGGRAFACYISRPGTDYLHIHRSFLRELGLETVADLARRQMDKVYSSDLRQALEVLQDPKTSMEAWRWMLGERIYPRSLQKMGLSQNVDVQFALTIFQQVQSMLSADGYSIVCLLIDEMEMINQLHVLKRQAMFDALRHLVDENPTNLCLVFACTPAGWDEIFKYAFALSRRLSRNVVYLESMTKATTRARV
ncbi:MAG: BREX system ATP-binding domain-containing protein, partial [Candidatus Bathyarchaeia archaeon]